MKKTYLIPAMQVELAMAPGTFGTRNKASLLNS